MGIIGSKNHGCAIRRTVRYPARIIHQQYRQLGTQVFKHLCGMTVPGRNVSGVGDDSKICLPDSLINGSMRHQMIQSYCTNEGIFKHFFFNGLLYFLLRRVAHDEQTDAGFSAVKPLCECNSIEHAGGPGQCASEQQSKRARESLWSPRSDPALVDERSHRRFCCAIQGR